MTETNNLRELAETMAGQAEKLKAEIGVLPTGADKRKLLLRLLSCRILIDWARSHQVRVNP